jgi:DNA-binding response OmpR family regulator
MKTVLVVDDNANLRLLMRLTLGKEFHVAEASEGVTALAYLLRTPPDAVLLDIMMPGPVDGMQVLSNIKSNPRLKDIPVAMVTARGQSADYRAGIASGADAYFIKPFSPLELVNWVRKVLL